MIDFFLPAAVAMSVGVYTLLITVFALYCVLAVLAEREMWAWSTAVLVIVFLALGGTGVFNLPVWALHHPVTLLWRLGGYLLAGAVWGTFKWWQYCLKKRDAVEEHFRVWKLNRSVGSINSLAGFSGIYGSEVLAPAALDNKERIITWMYLWPFSVIGTLFGDWLKRLFTRIYRTLEGLLDSISARVWRGSSVMKDTK